MAFDQNSKCFKIIQKVDSFLSELEQTLLISTVQCLHNNKLLQHNVRVSDI